MQTQSQTLSPVALHTPCFVPKETQPPSRPECSCPHCPRQWRSRAQCPTPPSHNPLLHPLFKPSHIPHNPALPTQAAAEAAAPAASSNGGDEPKKLWGGRFTGATDPLMERFNESLPFDKRMWKEDIQVCVWEVVGRLHII